MIQQQENRPQPQDHHEEAENMRRLLEQHWLHCRHIESERAWFMNVYAIISGGIITYTFTTKPMELRPIYFLMAFTVIGLLLAYRWSIAFDELRERVNTIIEYFGLKTVIDSKGKTASLTMDIPKNWFFKIFRTGFLFCYFYAIILVGLIILVVKY